MENYSKTKCPHCKETNFEMVMDKPSKSNPNMEYLYLRCTSCETFLQAFDPFYTDGNTLYSKIVEIEKIVNNTLKKVDEK